MEPNDRSTRLPFAPGELLFLVEGGTRDLEIEAVIGEMVAKRGGTLEPSRREGEEGSRSLGDDESRQMQASLQEDDRSPAEPGAPLLRATFPAGSLAEEVSRLEEFDADLRGRKVSATALPNWLIGGASNGPAGGSGAGPGARPVPFDMQPLPLDEAKLAPLRAAADRREGRVRLVILDAWNDDKGESQRLFDESPLLQAVNDWCGDLGVAEEHIPPRNGDRAHQDDDPFPMPDHGPFAAYLAESVIGGKRISLHPSVVERAGGALRLPSDGNISIEGWRVLDENGVGDSATLIRTLDSLTASIVDGDRVVVNMSLVFTIPDIPPMVLRMLKCLWRDQWGASPLDALDEFVRRLPRNAPAETERLDLALCRAVQRLSEKGALIVAAAGNDSHGPNERYATSYPAAYDEVLSVTAAAYDGTGEAWYANLAGPGGVALFAGDVTPKEDLDPTYPVVGPFTDSHVPIRGAGVDPENEKGAVAWAGTSFAAPQASGLAALLWAANPTETAASIAHRLRALASQTLPHVSGNGTPYIRLLQY